MSRNFWKPSKSISWCKQTEMEMKKYFIESLNWTLENTHIILIKFVSRCWRRPTELLENIFELLARVWCANESETRECKSGWIIKIDKGTYSWRDLEAAGTRSATIYPTECMPSETKRVEMGNLFQICSGEYEQPIIWSSKGGVGLHRIRSSIFQW